MFVEDQAHEVFLVAILQRFSSKYNVAVKLKSISARGGRGKVISELKQYQNDLQRNKETLPDLIIVGTDSNCKGFREREKEINRNITDIEDFVISMIPEPHIERWFLIDPDSFKTVFGKGCPTPDQKCERDRYKDMFLKAITEVGVIPLLGGIEHITDLVNEMNLQRMKNSDKSIQRFLNSLQRCFRSWQQSGN